MFESIKFKSCGRLLLTTITGLRSRLSKSKQGTRTSQKTRSCYISEMIWQKKRGRFHQHFDFTPKKKARSLLIMANNIWQDCAKLWQLTQNLQTKHCKYKIWVTSCLLGRLRYFSSKPGKEPTRLRSWDSAMNKGQ